MPVADSATTFPTWTVQVNDSNPIWAFCKQGNHCSQGMVFSVNAKENTANSFSAFQEKAKQSNGSSSSGSDASGATDDNGVLSSHTHSAGAAVAVLAAIVGSFML